MRLQQTSEVGPNYRLYPPCEL